MPDLSLSQWAIGILCAFCAGVSKTGVPGLGILVVPLIVLTVGDARLAAGWLLPMLCAADLFALAYWGRHAAAWRLFSLAPWVVAGMALGAAALSLNERILRPAVGAIVLVMLAIYLYRRMRAGDLKTGARTAPYGFTAGFATTVANAAGPVMNIYLLSKNLPKEEFVATGAWFFFAVNLAKVPIYAWHGLFSARSLTFDALMIPAIVGGAIGGRRLIDHIPQRIFELLVLVLTVASTLLLFR